MPDDTSRFIVADFDGEGWRDTVRRFLKVCEQHNIPIAIERSRSGNGAHAWCFFKEPYPSYRSRQIFFALLREAQIIGELEKNENFDRLFPNQDYQSGKGLGNLIALPLQGASRKLGNTVFLDPKDDFKMIADQWQFLHDIHSFSTADLDEHYNVLVQGATSTTMPIQNKSGELALVLGRAIALEKQNVPTSLINFLRKELNMRNIEFLVKEKSGLPTYGMEKYICTMTSDSEHIFVPRGFLPKLKTWLDENKIIYNIRDERITADLVNFKTHYELFEYQKAVTASFADVDNGVLVAPAGSGKTIMGLAIIAQKQQSAIILTHRRQIYDQWLERVEHGLGIAKTHIGQICGTKKEVALPVTVTMVQTLARLKDWKEITSSFGTVIIDECHHVPARMFREVVSKFKAHYLFGLTATPNRKYNDSKLIEAYLGPVIHTVDKADVAKMQSTDIQNAKPASHDRVIMRTTNVKAPFGDTPRNFPIIAKVITNDSARNMLIVIDIKKEVEQGKKCLVLTERKEHAEMLKAHLRKDFEAVLFSGDLSAVQRRRTLQRIKSGRFQILIATGQILGEGVDIAGLEVLFLALPISFHGKLAQYIGRINREGGSKIIYDYRDIEVPFLEKLWKKRLAHYRKNEFIIEEQKPV